MKSSRQRRETKPESPRANFKARSLAEGPVLRTVDRLLLEAAKKGDASGVRSALGDGANRDAKDEKGKTAMCYAMAGTHADQPWPMFPEVVEVLQNDMQRKAAK